MKEALTSANFDDFRKRYEGTYGNYSHNLESPIMVKLETITDGKAHFVDAKGNTFYVVADSGIPFEFFPVDRRVANTPEGVLYSRRKTATQWRRGVCDSNTAIVNLTTGRGKIVSFVTLPKLYQPDTNYLGAYNQFIKDKSISVALSDKFCILKDKVCLYDIPVGYFTESKAKIHPMFKQEFSDLVRRGNFPIEVEALHGNNS